MRNYVITIARGYGSGGKTIGKMLAERLNISYYNRELLRIASDESGIHERFFDQADERGRTGLFQQSRVYKGEVISPDRSDFVSEDNLFNYQAKAIKNLAEKESCVIVGRCADYVLKDMPNLVRVFVHAPMESCINTVMELYGVSRKEAEKTILATDKSRSSYYKRYTGQEWNNATNYDLCLNSEELGFERSVELIEAYLKIRFEIK